MEEGNADEYGLQRSSSKKVFDNCISGPECDNHLTGLGISHAHITLFANEVTIPLTHHSLSQVQELAFGM